jgi:hypothetical protein
MASEARNVVLVCGGRTYGDVHHVWMVLDQLHRYMPITLVVQGGATGADFYAKRWANDHGVKWVEMAADWAANGRAAGPIRNQKMLDEYGPDYVIAFPGGRGTKDMVTRAKANGYRVEIHDKPGTWTRPAVPQPSEEQSK